MLHEDRSKAPVAFLFLGETLLIPHLFPIVEALVQLDPTLPIDLWVGDPATYTLLAGRLGEMRGGARIRQTPGFAPMPARKLAVLARLWPRLWNARAIICAEQTSLWIPTLLPFGWRFIKTSHGVGSMSARDDRRRRSAWRLLVPSEMERDTYLRRGFPPEKIMVTGYVKSAFQRTSTKPLFANERPTLLYAPHWQRHRSSWWNWGRAVIKMLAEQRDFNVILAPHQRLVEHDPGVRAVLDAVAMLPHIHTDLDSFALVDGSYPAAADIYLGDTSSQVVEFLARPRPCVFLNSQQLDWRATDDHGFWECGDVVETFERIESAISESASLHSKYRDIQERFARQALGVCGPEAPLRAARIILEAIGCQPSQDTTRRPSSVVAQA